MSIKKYLPSKKFSYLIGGVTVACLVVFVLLPLLLKGETSQASNVEIELLSFDELLTLDSDGDGLYDWEEILWGMDPFNPDTTGNGILDGQEVAARRKELQAQSGGGDDRPLTYTDALAQQMFLFVAGNPNAQLQDIDNFAKTLTSDAFDLDIFNYLNKNDISISQNISIETYYNSVVDIISQLAFIPVDLTLIEAYMLFEDDVEHRQVLINQINIYKDLLDSFLALPVYKDAFDLHLNIANSFVQTITLLETILFNTFRDPVIALSALGQYSDINDSFILNIENLTNFFRQKGLVYF